MRADGLVVSPVTYVELAPVFDGDTARQEYFLYHLEVSWTEAWTRAAGGKSGAMSGVVWRKPYGTLTHAAPSVRWPA